MLAGSRSEAPSLPDLVVGFAATRIGTFGYRASRTVTRLESQGPSPAALITYIMIRLLQVNS